MQAALHVDIRNLITHNRGIVNRILKQRQPDFPAELGTSIVFKNDREVGEIIGGFVYWARQLDASAAEKFNLPKVRRFRIQKTEHLVAACAMKWHEATEGTSPSHRP